MNTEEVIVNIMHLTLAGVSARLQLAQYIPIIFIINRIVCERPRIYQKKRPSGDCEGGLYD